VNDPRALEQLRQERETFDRAKAEVAQWSRLRLVMGYAGIAALLGVAVVSGIIVLNPSRYPTGVITVAATTLLVDILSLSVSIFKLVLQQGNATRLKPVTIVRQSRRYR
jgi:hypothetical protein